VLIYSGGDNNLDDVVINGLIDREKLTPRDLAGVNLVNQFDVGSQKPDCGDQDWEGCYRTVVNPGEHKPNELSSPVIESLGQVNMADPQTLSDFLVWGIKNYPAQNYMVILENHGEGWRGMMDDDSHCDAMTLPQLGQAFKQAQEETGEKIQVVGFAACLMGSTEVAYELKDATDYLAGLEEVGVVHDPNHFTWGRNEGRIWPYDKIFSADRDGKLFSELSPRQAAQKTVKEASRMPGITAISAVDLKQAANIAQAVEDLSKKLIRGKVSVDLLNYLLTKTQTFDTFGYKDPADFAQKILDCPQINDPKIKQASTTLVEAVNRAVIAQELHSYEYLNPENAHGLNIYGDPNSRHRSYSGTRNYLRTQFGQDSPHWLALLKILGRRENQFYNRMNKLINPQNGTLAAQGLIDPEAMLSANRQYPKDSFRYSPDLKFHLAGALKKAVRFYQASEPNQPWPPAELKSREKKFLAKQLTSMERKMYALLEQDFFSQTRPSEFTDLGDSYFLVKVSPVKGENSGGFLGEKSPGYLVIDSSPGKYGIRVTKISTQE